MLTLLLIFSILLLLLFVHIFVFFRFFLAESFPKVYVEQVFVKIKVWLCFFLLLFRQLLLCFFSIFNSFVYFVKIRGSSEAYLFIYFSGGPVQRNSCLFFPGVQCNAVLIFFLFIILILSF